MVDALNCHTPCKAVRRLFLRSRAIALRQPLTGILPAPFKNKQSAPAERKRVQARESHSHYFKKVSKTHWRRIGWTVLR
jgi:hypothetical protein